MSVWVLISLFRSSATENNVSSDVQTDKRIFHTGHRGMISPLYMFLYVSLDVQTEKIFLHWSQRTHWSQGYDLSPVCILMCFFRCSTPEKQF